MNEHLLTAEWVGTCEAELSEDDDQTGVVSGVAAPFGVAGRFPMGGGTGLIRLAKGCAVNAPSGLPQLGLVAHDVARPLARTDNNTLEFAVGDDGIDYRMSLYLGNSEKADAYQNVRDRTITAASIGFVINKSRRVKDVDNSAGSTTGDKRVMITEATEITVYEVSLVALGAFAGADANVTAGLPLAAQDVVDILKADPQIDATHTAGVWTFRRRWDQKGDSEVNYDDESGDMSGKTDTQMSQEWSETYDPEATITETETESSEASTDDQSSTAAAHADSETIRTNTEKRC